MPSMDKETQNEIAQIRERLIKLEQKYAVHQHNDIDGTNHLRKTFQLDQDQFGVIGLGTLGSTSSRLNTTAEQLQFSTNVGKESGKVGFVNKADILQLNLLHQPLNTSKQSFINAMRTPVVTPFENTSVSTTIGGNTVTISGYGFTTNELALAQIDIFDSSGVFVESQTIASNTATVVTISGTWLASTSGGTFFIYMPVFFGSAETIFQRFYTQEGTGGGIRFGVGVTAGTLNQNGLLYMDATGDLYWRDKAGAAVKLN